MYRLRVVGFRSWNPRRSEQLILCKLEKETRREWPLAFRNPRNPRKRERLLAVYFMYKDHVNPQFRNKDVFLLLVTLFIYLFFISVHQFAAHARGKNKPNLKPQG